MTNERVLAGLPGAGVILTTHRIRRYESQANESSVTSMMLEQVASCSVTQLSKPWLIAIAGVVLLISLWSASGTNKGWLAGIVLAVVFAIIYFATRREVLSVASAGDTIHVELTGMSVGAIRDLLNDIEIAQNALYLRIPTA